MPAHALKRRIAPSVPLTLTLQSDGGESFTLEFRLTFDFNAAAIVEEKTGLNLLTAEVWTSGLSSRSLSVMFWAAVLAQHPEYDTVDDAGEPSEEGLEVIRSYMEVGNTDFIHEALWNAYFMSLPKEKREALERARKAIETGSSPQTVAPKEPAAATSLSNGSTSGQSPDTTSDLTLKSSAA
jgi:hypothetical protein